MDKAHLGWLGARKICSFEPVPLQVVILYKDEFYAEKNTYVAAVYRKPADIDKGSMSGKTSHGNDGGSQRANVSTNGLVDRSSVGEIGTDKQRTKNRILNEQVKDPENKNNRPER